VELELLLFSELICQDCMRQRRPLVSAEFGAVQPDAVQDDGSGDQGHDRFLIPRAWDRIAQA